jgi:hypothetical protein
MKNLFSAIASDTLRGLGDFSKMLTTMSDEVGFFGYPFAELLIVAKRIGGVGLVLR